MQLHFLEEENLALQRKLSTHEELFLGIISELRQELQIKEELLLTFQRSVQEKSGRSPMQMRQAPGNGFHPMLEVCQENVPSCSLSFFQGIDVSFGGKHTTIIDGKDFGIKDQGIVDSLEVEGISYCACMGYGNNEEGEGSKVAKVLGTQREHI